MIKLYTYDDRMTIKTYRFTILICQDSKHLRVPESPCRFCCSICSSSSSTSGRWWVQACNGGIQTTKQTWIVKPENQSNQMKSVSSKNFKFPRHSNPTGLVFTNYTYLHITIKISTSIIYNIIISIDLNSKYWLPTVFLMLGAWNCFYNRPGQLTMWQKYLPEFMQNTTQTDDQIKDQGIILRNISPYPSNTTSLLRTPGRSEGPIANQFNQFQVTTPAPPWLDCTLLRWPWGFFWLQTLWTTGISKETRTVNDGLTIPSRTGSSETWKAIAVSNIRLWSGDGHACRWMTNQTIFSLYVSR